MLQAEQLYKVLDAAKYQEVIAVHAWPACKSDASHANANQRGQAQIAICKKAAFCATHLLWLVQAIMLMSSAAAFDELCLPDPKRPKAMHWRNGQHPQVCHTFTTCLVTCNAKLQHPRAGRDYSNTANSKAA